jgi:hypothetical protein
VRNGEGRLTLSPHLLDGITADHDEGADTERDEAHKQALRSHLNEAR